MVVGCIYNDGGSRPVSTKTYTRCLCSIVKLPIEMAGCQFDRRQYFLPILTNYRTRGQIILITPSSFLLRMPGFTAGFQKTLKRASAACRKWRSNQDFAENLRRAHRKNNANIRIWAGFFLIGPMLF